MQLSQVLRSPAYGTTLSLEDWDDLIPAAASASLLPALDSHLKLPEVQNRIPAHIQVLLDTAASLNAERNAVIVSEAVSVAGLLNQIDIQPVALKGIAYLLSGIYPDPAARYMLDIDLLVPIHELPRAVAHLHQNGCFENESGRLIQFRHHNPSLRRPGLPQIELHHRVGQGICAGLLPASLILASASPLSVDGVTFLIPSPTSLVNHLILHSQLAHSYYDRMKPPLRALVDLAQLQKHFGNQINWSSLIQTYKTAGESGTLAMHLKQANHVLGLQVPNQPKLTVFQTLRWIRRLILNLNPALRFFDPTYVILSIFSRRLRLMSQILQTPSSWPQVIRTIMHVDFYRNLFAI